MKLSAQAMDYHAFLQSGQWFRALPAALQTALLTAANVRRLDAGERLFARGDALDGLYAVIEGTIRVTGVSADGKEALLTLMESPHWFGEIALFDRLPRTHDAIADGAAAVIHVPQPALDILLREQPAYWREFALLLTHKLRLAFVALEEVALLPAALRLARRLLMIAEGYGEWRDRSRRVIAVQQEQLAMMLSLSRQTTNQILKELEAQRVIRLARGEIEILDVDRLRAAGRSIG